jgi:hypothetical protein
VEAALQPGDLVPGAVTAAGEVEMYSFSAQAGTRVLLPIAHTGGVVADVVLIAPGGTRIDGFRASTVRRLTLPESGTYVMYVYTATVTHSGSFNIGLEQIGPPAAVQANLTRGTVRSDSIRAAGEVDLFTLSGQAGTSVLLTLVSTAGIVVDATVLAPSGTVVQTLRANILRDVQLAETGTYLIYVHAATLGGSANYNIGVQ